MQTGRVTPSSVWLLLISTILSAPILSAAALGQTELSAALTVTAVTPLEQAQWQYRGDKFACSLRHPVADFGSYQLRHRAGGALQLQLQADWLNQPEAQSTLTLLVPDWQRPHQAPTTPYPLIWQGQRGYANEAAPAALQALLRGWSWQSQIQARAGRYLVQAQNVQAKAAAQQFLACQQQLLPRSFEQLRNLQLPMASARFTLTAAQKIEVDAVAAYVNADPKVARILIDAHTDNRGDSLENLVLSRARSDEVVSRLVAAGVSAHMIEARGHGERYPIASNRTADGRQRNRRVSIRLELEGQSLPQHQSSVDFNQTLPQPQALGAGQ
ncbi:OmpA family protein [uncultured Ferrimonas sp.]|uniref:MotY family protein n=1 Tax=uncultured Ferrimonas sp. TaxID=432640 RepID=UPI002632EAFA|nr:OmpA family protein [uncultured Ferrimonas sp.]